MIARIVAVVAVAAALVVAVPLATSHGTTTADSSNGYVISVRAGFADPAAVATPMITGYSSADTITEQTMTAAWSKDGDMLVVTLFGSGSCPRMIQSVVADDAGSDRQFVSLRVVDTRNHPATSVPAGVPSDPPMVTYPRTCTRDLRPLTSFVHPPDGVSPAYPLRLTAGGNPVVLPAMT